MLTLARTPGKMGWKDGNTRDRERMDSCSLRPGKSAQAGKRQIPNPGSSAVLGDTLGPVLLGPVPVPGDTLLHLFPGEGGQLWRATLTGDCHGTITITTGIIQLSFPNLQ